ncbi:hypothetical protein FGIG_00501 [Fasciola gigantica]|uniref:Uncharacterized protein n=1 Tax=Fasciola gigantica TaxID=46835 RepID=A0A504Z412_FASGI|nr:hypothetical protein FGIG_00501 [Fasciola gigantica]
MFALNPKLVCSLYLLIFVIPFGDGEFSLNEKAKIKTERQRVAEWRKPLTQTVFDWTRKPRKTTVWSSLMRAISK